MDAVGAVMRPLADVVGLGLEAGSAIGIVAAGLVIGGPHDSGWRPVAVPVTRSPGDDEVDGWDGAVRPGTRSAWA